MLIATINCDLATIALEEAFDAVPGMTVEADRVAAHSTEWTLPSLWVSHDDFEAVDAAFEAASSIDTVVGSATIGHEKFYLVDWDERVETRVNECVDKAGTMLQARATAPEGWRLKFRFIDREQIDAFRERFADHGYSFTLLELTEPGRRDGSFGELTPRQREALVAAREAGYFKVPREKTATELASELDLSQQAISELLRRGTAKLVDEMLSREGNARDWTR